MLWSSSDLMKPIARLVCASVRSIFGSTKVWESAWQAGLSYSVGIGSMPNFKPLTAWAVLISHSPCM